MASRYEKIWRAIKRAATSKNPKQRGIFIHCRAEKIPTIVLAVKQIKSAENRARIALDLGKYTKMKIDRETGKQFKFGARIRFELMSEELAENL